MSPLPFAFPAATFPFPSYKLSPTNPFKLLLFPDQLNPEAFPEAFPFPEADPNP